MTACVTLLYLDPLFFSPHYKGRDIAVSFIVQLTKEPAKEAKIFQCLCTISRISFTMMPVRYSLYMYTTCSF